jgi:hypothetical protein
MPRVLNLTLNSVDCEAIVFEGFATDGFDGSDAMGETSPQVDELMRLCDQLE